MTSRKPTLLVTGASGVVGWTLCELASADWSVVGTAFRHPAEHPCARIRIADLTSAQARNELFEETRPDAVVHLAALSSPDYCEQHPEVSEAVNVVASAEIAALCADLRIPCVFASSDLVFDGEHAPYSEDDSMDPPSVYGRHKALAEQRMRSRYPALTVCRLPLMFGPGSPAAPGALKSLLQRLRSGETVHLFEDEFRTPVSTVMASRGILLAMARAPAQTLHLGGTERLSRYELGQAVVQSFDLPDAGLVPGRQKDVSLPAPRARDVSLDSARAYAIDFDPGTVRDQLRAARDMMERLEAC